MAGAKLGIISMPVINASPETTFGYGQLYTKADNNFYFKNADGTEFLVSLGSSDYGEMGNLLGDDAPEVLHSADEWHGMFHANITGSLPHLNEGFSFVAGFDGSIASVADNGSGDARFTDVGHGLETGDYITIQASVAGYTGVHQVVKITDDLFDVTGLAYSATATGTWQMGSYLLVACAGHYTGAWNASLGQSLNNAQHTIVCPFINTTLGSKASAKRLLQNATDTGSIGGNGIMLFNAGDRIWFGCQSTGAQTVTMLSRNMSVD